MNISQLAKNSKDYDMIIYLENKRLEYNKCYWECSIKKDIKGIREYLKKERIMVKMKEYFDRNFSILL